MGGKCGEGWAQVYSWPSLFALYLKLPNYQNIITSILSLIFFLSFCLSFFFLQINSLFFNELSLLAVQGMFPVRGSWGNSVLGLLPGGVSQVLEQGPRAMAQ